MLGFEAHGWAVQVIAAAAALAGAALLSYVERRFAAQEEALIGVLFVLAASLALLPVGVYLVFASLIIPALAAPRLLFAYALGALAYAIGLTLSLTADLPAAPVIVCTLALLGTAVWLFVPSIRR